jgi:2-dehydro-3-deoxyphosphogalactonate aldolase
MSRSRGWWADRVSPPGDVRPQRAAEDNSRISGISFPDALTELPLVAILRGVRPDEVEGIGSALVEAGFRILEVTLNSPDPFRSIETLARRFGDDALIGGGTVLSPENARRVVSAGGTLVIMPHADTAVIRAAKEAGAWCVPGVATPTEGFAALAAGADALKLFPAEAMPPVVLKAWRAVFPPETRFLPVGGIMPESMADYVAAGAVGFGIGSAVYKVGISADDVGRRAVAFVGAWRNLER